MSSEEGAEAAEVESVSNGGELCDSVLGRKFESHSEVQNFMYNLEVQSRQKYAVYDSKKISTARLKGVKRFLKPELIYYSITYACIHGGRKYRCRSKGVRQSSTFKMDCPFRIKFTASKDGNYLEIVECSANHEGHGLSEKVYEHLPQVRRLNEEDVKEVQQFLEVGWNSKLLQSKLLLDKGKKVTLKDINNIKYKWKGANDILNAAKFLEKEGDSDDFLKVAKFLEREYEANVYLLEDETQNFKALYFSTEDMRRSMLAFPEIVFLDGTYKLHNKLTLMIIFIEDANGLSEIVGACLICDDDYETFKWCLSIFQGDNDEASNSIKCFMTDEDLLQRDVINEIFVDIPVYICNRMESLSQKIKAVVPPNNSLCLFLKSFVNWMISHNEEMNSKVAKMILKKNITKYDENSCEKKYMDLLTPYAYSYVLRQCAGSKKVTLIEDQNGVFTVKIKKDTITVDTLRCECSDFMSMLLPCRHILCLRNYLNLPLYCEELCNKRWLKENYLKSYRVKLGGTENVPLSYTVTDVSEPKILSPAEKRKLANTIASNLVTLICDSPDSQFNYKIDCLKDIEILWRQGCEVQINQINTNEDVIMDEFDSEVSEITTDETVDVKITDQNQVPSISSIVMPDKDLKMDISQGDESDCRVNKTSRDRAVKRKITNKNKVQSISTIIKPHNIQKEVRRRGSELAVTDLKKKRKVSTPTTFSSKQDEEKIMQILKEVVSECDLIPRCLEGEYKIKSVDIKKIEQLSHCLLNPAMDLQLVKDFFEPIAFMSITQKIESLEENHLWRCTACNDELGKLKSICCDGCLKWFHFQCAGISKVPARQTWFCGTCY